MADQAAKNGVRVLGLAVASIAGYFGLIARADVPAAFVSLLELPGTAV